MKKVELGFFFAAFVAIIGALIITAVNEASFNISQVLLTLALVLITCIYAMRTSDIAKATRAQADASVKMAEEMKNTRNASLKPIVNIIWTGCNKKANGEISASFKSIGQGPALNLNCYLTHEKYKFEFKHDRYTVLEKGEGPKIDLPIENFDFKAWDGLSINCDYESVFGEKFRSILKCESEEKRSLEIIKLKGDNND